MAIIGYINNVAMENMGSTALSWVGTQLTVADASDFSYEGGQVMVGDAVVSYSGVVEGDPYDVLVTASAAPQPISEDVSAWVYPLAPVKVAHVVTLEDGDSIPCVVPHALQVMIAEGTRDVGVDAEMVELELSNGVWFIKQVIGELATIDGLDEALDDLRDRLDLSAEALEAAKLDLEQRAKANADAIATARTELADADAALKLQQDQTEADLTQAQQDLNAADLILQRAADDAAAAARAADEKAGQAQTSADGKNSITDSPNAPTSSTPGKAVGDTWRQVVGGVIVGVWNWTALGWVPRPISSAAIDNLDVGKLTAGTASISSVVATKLAADLGAYRVLTADKVVIASGDNLLIDPLFRDSKAWNQPQWIKPSSGKTGTGGTLVIPASSVKSGCYVTLTQQWMATIQPGATYRVGGWVKTSVDAPPGSLTVYLREYGVEGTGFTWASPSTRSNPTTVPAGVWTWVGGTFVANATGVRAAVGFFSQSTFSGEAVWSDAEFRAMGTGELLVDGAVTSRSLAAEAVTADKVLANEAYARIIGGLLANFQAVFANKVTAGMLVADQVLAAKVAALVGDFADLFATKITAGMLNVDEAMAQKLQAVVATFQEVFAGTIIADMIKLDTLAGKSLNGVGIYSPSQTAVPRVEVADSQLRTVRMNSDGDEVSGVVLGGPTDDRMQLLNASTGEVLAGFDAQGDGTARNMDVAKLDAGAVEVESLTVGGELLEDIIAPYTTGILAEHRVGPYGQGNSVNFGSGWLGYYELMYPSNPGRSQECIWESLMYCSQAGIYEAILLTNATPGYTDVPMSPMVDGSKGVQTAYTKVYATGPGYYPFRLRMKTGNYGGTYRVLLACRTTTSGAYGYVATSDGWPGHFYANDLGARSVGADGGYNRGGGTPYSAPASAPAETAPAIVRHTYRTVWRASQVGTWRDDLGWQDAASTKLRQGYYPPTKRGSHILFGGGAYWGQVDGKTSTAENGKTIAQAIPAGATVKSIKIKLPITRTYASSGATISLAPRTETSLAKITTAANETRQLVKANTTPQITLANIGNSIRSVAMGADTSSLSEYLQVNPALSGIELEITYVK